MTQQTILDDNAPMADRLIIEHLEFQGHCGVSASERQALQPIAVDAEMDCPSDILAAAAASGDITHTIDYASIAARIVEVGHKQPYVLLETLADSIVTKLFTEFPITRVSLWVRKMTPPVTDVHGSVGVRLERDRPALSCDPQPASFLRESLSRLPGKKALDVAAGRGRNTLYLAEHDFEVAAIDRDEQALAELTATAKQRGLQNVMVRTMDLEADPIHLPDLGCNQYDVVLVFFYLFRPLMPTLLRALKPGGTLVYETFLIDNHLRYQHPRRKEFCLQPNELLDLTRGLRVLHYDEGAHAGDSGSDPLFTARLLAQKV